MKVFSPEVIPYHIVYFVYGMCCIDLTWAILEGEKCSDYVILIIFLLWAFTYNEYLYLYIFYTMFFLPVLKL